MKIAEGIEKQEGDTLIEFKTVEGTPFTVAKTEEGWYVLLGMNRLTEKPFKLEKEAVEDAKRITWERIFVVAAIVTRETLRTELKTTDNE